MGSISDFLAMGGYAAYVWPAYGVFALVLGGLIAFAAWRARAVRKELDQIETARKDRFG